MTIHIDRDSPVPAFIQIEQDLRRQIMSGQLPQGARLARETLLAERYGASRVTVRRALQELAKAQLVQRIHGVLDGAPVLYWPELWGTRALLYVWDESAAAAVIGTLGNPAWRVREMGARVVAARELPAASELAELLVESLNLEGVNAADIDPEAPLFGDGLGLDSIDALELALAISKRYGFQLRSDSDENRRIFGSLRALAEHVQANRTA